MGDKQKKKRRRQQFPPPKPWNNCPNCKERFKSGETGHYVPPGMGDPGFFICERKD